MHFEKHFFCIAPKKAEIKLGHFFLCTLYFQNNILSEEFDP